MNDKEKAPTRPPRKPAKPLKQAKDRQQAMKDKARDAALHQSPLGEKPPGHAKEQPQRKLG